MKSWLAFLVVILVFSHTVAQKPDLHLKHLTGEQGLSQTHVMSVIQDHKGFIWICTENGLNKFDGYKITVYKNLADDSTSIESNIIRYIFEDSKKNLWIGTSNGLNRYDRENDRFVRIKIPGNEPLNNSYVNAIFEDSRGNLWVGCEAGAYYFDPNNNVNHFLYDAHNESSISHDNVTGFCEDTHG